MTVSATDRYSVAEAGTDEATWLVIDEESGEEAGIFSSYEDAASERGRLEDEHIDTLLRDAKAAIGSQDAAAAIAAVEMLPESSVEGIDEALWFLKSAPKLLASMFPAEQHAGAELFVHAAAVLRRRDRDQ